MDIVGNRTLYSILASHAAEKPDAPWLTFVREDGKTFEWTFGKFLASVHRAVGLLLKLGIGPGDVFNIYLPNHPAYPQLIIAASALGAVAVPTNPKSTVEELKYLLEHSESKLVFTDGEALDRFKEAGKLPVVICDTTGKLPEGYLIYEEELVRCPSQPLPEQGESETLLQLLYTSGTTSRPKGVMLTNANFIYGAEVFRKATGLRSDDHHIIPLPLFHAAAQCHALWPSLVAGCRVTLLSRFSASRFFAQATQYGATMAALFGAPLRMLLNQPEGTADRTHKLRNITFAQSLAADAYVEWSRRFSAPLQHLWGMTETCSLPVMSLLTTERNLAAMGKQVEGYEVKIIDEAGNKVKTGEVGQLTVRGIPGRSLMYGYLKNPEATAKTLREVNGDIWLYSGDAVREDENGFLYFVDRGNDLIRRSGENISSIEVEGVIAQLEGVQDVCVVGLADPVRDEVVAVAIVPKPDSTVTAEDIQGHCAKHLISHKIPEHVAFITEMPRTSVGKIQKNIVREILKKERAS